MSEQRKAVIKNADMSEEMQQDAVDIASQALAKYNIEKVSPPPRAWNFSHAIGALWRGGFNACEKWRDDRGSRDIRIRGAVVRKL